MTSDMAFDCLLVSRDPQVVGITERILRSLSVCTTICLRASTVADRLAERGAELLVIDLEGDETHAAFFDSLPTSWGQWKPIVVAITAFGEPRQNAHVVARKPLTLESATQSLKLAYSKMLVDYRRHTRYPIMIPSLARDMDHRAVRVVVTDIGYGGVGLRTTHPLAIGDVLACRFSLPDVKKTIDFHARVLWTRADGVAGCDFFRIRPPVLCTLLDWLDCRNPIKAPSRPVLCGESTNASLQSNQ
jgi:hypothetical protein